MVIMTVMAMKVVIVVVLVMGAVAGMLVVTRTAEVTLVVVVMGVVMPEMEFAAVVMKAMVTVVMMVKVMVVVMVMLAGQGSKVIVPQCQPVPVTGLPECLTKIMNQSQRTLHQPLIGHLLQPPPLQVTRPTSQAVLMLRVNKKISGLYVNVLWRQKKKSACKKSRSLTASRKVET